MGQASGHNLLCSWTPFWPNTLKGNSMARYQKQGSRKFSGASLSSDETRPNLQSLVELISQVSKSIGRLDERSDPNLELLSKGCMITKAKIRISLAKNQSVKTLTPLKKSIQNDPDTHRNLCCWSRMVTPFDFIVVDNICPPQRNPRTRSHSFGNLIRLKPSPPFKTPLPFTHIPKPPATGHARFYLPPFSSMTSLLTISLHQQDIYQYHKPKRDQ
uniref:Uncharacterized protein n=1 Tax=Cucumis melo TaxID=3656 RepID=A0A9I9EIF8_CUCME